MKFKPFFLPLVLVALSVLYSVPSFATCTLNTSITTVQDKICTPVASTTVPSTFTFSGIAHSAAGIYVTQLYVDGVKHGDYFTATPSTSLSLGTGSHRLTLIAIDKNTARATSTAYVTVGTSTNTPQVDLSWHASTTSGVNSYIVYRSKTSGSGYSKVGTSSTTSFVDRPAAGTYYYVVTSVSSAGESKYSNQIALTVN